jgi:phage terminase large subunit-like protein
MGPIAFSAQYQQSPIPPGGTIIKRQWLASYDEVPSHDGGDHIIMSWDIALSEEERGDYFACVVLLRRKEVLVFFVLEVIRGRLRFDDLKRKILEVKKRYGVGTLLIEDSPISKGLIQSLEESSINVTACKPETDKRSRLIAQSDLFAGGSVRLVAGLPVRGAGICAHAHSQRHVFSGAPHDPPDDRNRCYSMRPFARCRLKTPAFRANSFSRSQLRYAVPMR